nr:immunoglobulin heavy chain junction region [Mus musculus]
CAYYYGSSYWFFDVW